MRRTRIAALAAFFVTFLVHAALVPAQGLTDDDDFYAPAAIRYAEWVGSVFTEPSEALSQRAIDAAFSLNREHPPFAKLVMGLTHAVFHDALGVYGSLDAARLGVSLLAAVLAAALVLLLSEAFGLVVALAAPALLLSLPRFFFHSEVATLDVPVAALVLCVVLAYVRAERSRAWVAASAVIFGLALLTKLNAPFSILPCVILEIMRRRRAFTFERGALSLPEIPHSLIAMALGGPALFVLLWPHLWFDTLNRLGAYLAFHLNHYPIYLFYDGEIWEKPFAPWHAPFVLGFGSLPLPVVVLGLFGAVRAALALARVWRHGDAAGSGERLRALLLLQSAFSIGIVAFSHVPKYGGEKLFMPLFPFLCALAADGARMVAEAAARRARAPLVPAFGIVVVLACMPGVAGTVKHHGGYALSYYGELVGGLRGAVARGHERTYYDVADKPLARFLAEHAGGRTVCFEPNPKEYVRTYRWLKRDGVIGSTLDVLRDCKGAELVVLTHERRWSSYPKKKEELSRGELLFEKRIDGVPLYSVRARERR
jgi:Dolichyl-phosphate-mannose-protein mannosyltransferase